MSRKTNPINYLWLYIFDAAILGSVLNYGVSDRSRTVNRPKSPYLLTLLFPLWSFQLELSNQEFCGRKLAMHELRFKLSCGTLQYAANILRLHELLVLKLVASLM